MILRIVISISIVFSSSSFIAACQELLPNPSTTHLGSATINVRDFTETVIPITSLKITPSAKLGFRGNPSPTISEGFRFGTGFCLDAECRFIATNYHVAMMTKVRRIKRQKIVGRYLATGPHDEGATVNYLQNLGVLSYAKKRDLAIFELQHPIARHRGLSFSLDELQSGQEVDIYGYPFGGINPFRKLTGFPARFKAPTTSGFPRV